MSRPVKAYSGDITFAQNATTSSEIDTKNRTLAAISTPSAMTNTSLTLETSEDGSTWLPVYKDDGSQYTITISANQARYIHLKLEDTNCCQWIRLKGSSQESAARTLRYHIRVVR